MSKPILEVATELFNKLTEAGVNPYADLEACRKAVALARDKASAKENYNVDYPWGCQVTSALKFHGIAPVAAAVPEVIAGAEDGTPAPAAAPAKSTGLGKSKKAANSAESFE